MNTPVVTKSTIDTERPLLAVENLRMHYRTRTGVDIAAVDSVSFTLESGSILGIAGESGCGKSTLVAGCMGLQYPPLYRTGGDIRINNESITTLSAATLRSQVAGKQISMIPQGALNALNPTRRIRHLAADMIRSHTNTLDNRLLMQQLEERFEQIGMNPKRVLDAFAVELSGGMKQRVVIGISTLLNPPIVIADEPTSALDVSTQKAVIELLFDLIDKKIMRSMIFITHELPLLRHVADTIAIMYAGEFVEVGSTRQIIFDPRHPYTQALMQSMLTPEKGGNRSGVVLPGAPPDLSAPLPGCRFAPRCPIARAACSTESQQLLPIHDRQVRCAYV